MLQSLECMSMSRVKTCGDTVGKLLGLPRQVRFDNRPVRLGLYAQNGKLTALKVSQAQHRRQSLPSV